MTKFLKAFFVIGLIALCCPLSAQQKFPVTANVILVPPYSPFISDYIAPGANNLKLTFVFNDFKEPSWQVKLKLKIESANLKLETKPEFRTAPITVTPGVSVTLSGNDLAEYFDYKNMSVLGSAASTFTQNGRLSEGNYFFCFEVLDYKTGISLSNTSCTSAWIRLNDPPRVITPQCDAFIDPFIPLNIPFQWQLFNATSPNATQGTEYRVVVYEMTDPHANPFTAIQNSKVLQIFESDAQSQTSFIYNTSSPALDLGKTYIYQIKASDVGGRDLFKNNGLSEVCWFRYGYPENGRIVTFSPIADKYFRKNEQLYFRWSAPDVRIKNQPFVYELKIVPLNDDQTADDAIQNNTPWFTERTSENTFTNGMDLVVRKPLKSGLQYAWEVTAYSGRQTVAKSEIQKFTGPPVIDRFFAGNHIVIVTKANNKDSLNFSGIGKFRASDTDSIEVPFENLKLKRIVNYWVLESGSLVKDIQSSSPIIIEPRRKINGSSTFYPRTLKLDKNELAIEGEVQWKLPHLLKSGKPGIVKSERTWLNYDHFKLLGAARLSSENQFELLDPLDFTLQLNTNSDFLISDNKFELRAEGNLQIPKKVKGKGIGKVTVPFPRINQLFYFDSLTVANSDIAPIGNTRIYLHPTNVCIDLSEEKSPGAKTDESLWKGLYIYGYDIQFKSFTDQLSQLRFKRELSYHYADESVSPWVDASGLNFQVKKDFKSDTVWFNSFLGHITHFALSVDANSISNSSVTGEIFLPVFSTTEFFAFTIPLSEDGLQAGYLNNLDDKSFVFHKDGGEQEVKLTVKRGAFEEQRLLNLSIQLEWPALSIITQTVNNFKIWGDYRIGFSVPNGTIALDTQLQGTLSGYAFTVDGISAGNNKGYYSFAVTGKAHMGDDVAGNNGPPSANSFSTAPNKYAPQGPEFTLGQAQLSQVQLLEYQQQYDNVSQNVSRSIEASQEDKDNARQTLFNLTSHQSSSSTTLGDATSGFSGNISSTNPLASAKSGGLLSSLNSNQKEIVKGIISTVVAELSKPLTDSINHEADRINGKIRKEIGDITLTIEQQVNEKIESLIYSISQPIVDRSRNSTVDISSEIAAVADVVVQSVSSEVDSAITRSIKKDITTVFTDLVQKQVADRLTKYINDAGTQVIIKSLDGEIKIEDIPSSVIVGLDTVMRKIGNTVFDQINFSSISSMIEKTANDVLKGVDTDKIIKEIENGAKSVAANAVADVANKYVAVAASDLINKQLGVDVPVNFTGLANRLIKGEKVFSLDSVNIHMNTEIVELNSFIYYKKDIPVYGDVWQGNIDVIVKKPKNFYISLTYVNGLTKDGTHYWFGQINPTDGTTYKLGDIMPKKAKKLKNPVDLGIVKLVGASGRVYRHMKDAANRPIVPDATNDYGAFLDLVLFDSKGGNTMRLDLAGEFVMNNDKNYVVTFDGNVQIMNKAPQVTEIDDEATVKGTLHIMYNSAEKHFLGYGKVVVLKPGALCASGSVLVDTKPGQWKVEVGSREDRIQFIPGCAGWSPTGWLSVTQKDAELGLGLQYSINAQTPTLWMFLYEVNGQVSAGIAVGLDVAVQYNPDFAILKAGVWADLWAKVVINYKSTLPFSNWHHINLLDIYARGDLMVVFQPKPATLEGHLKGYVRVLGFISINFDAGFKKAIS